MTDTPGYRADEGESISIRPFLEAAWAERRRILMFIAAVLLGYALVAGAFLIVQSASRTASVPFRLVFEGADRGEYPNGTAFARADIISNANLTEVYRRNELEQYLPFDAFRNSLFVFESSPELMFLELEYQARLADTRLPAPERVRLEAEYKQKRDSLGVPQLRLQFVTASRLKLPPDLVMEKVLNDVLAVWAEQAAVQKGALGYPVELLTPSVILKDTLNTQTLLIRYDLLRRHVSRILDQVDRLNRLPGAVTMRVGNDRLSLLDLKTSLEDLLRFQLNPMIRRRLVYSLPAAEVELNASYLQDRIAEMQRSLDMATSRRTQLQEALAGFVAETPGVDLRQVQADPSSGQMPVTDTFLDRIITLAGRSGALEYRKDLTDRVLEAGAQALVLQEDISFYTDTLRLLREAARGRQATLKPEDASGAFDPIQNRVVEILTLTNEAYTKISESNLNPRAALYRLTGPYSARTLRPISAQWLMKVGLFVLIATTVLAVGVLGTSRLLRQQPVQ